MAQHDGKAAAFLSASIPVRDLIFLLGRQRTHQVYDAAAHLRIPNTSECGEELRGFRRLLRRSRRRGFIFGESGTAAGPVDQSLVEIEEPGIENSCHIEESSRADAVNALFIFLHLLEREPEKFCELLLRHAKRGSPRANLIAHVLVDRIRLFFRHRRSRLGFAFTMPHFAVREKENRRNTLPVSQCAPPGFHPIRRRVFHVPRANQKPAIAAVATFDTGVDHQMPSAPIPKCRERI